MSGTVVPVEPVMHAQDPTAAALLDVVDGVAGHVLQHPGHHRFGEMQHELAHLRADADDLMQALQLDLGGGTGCLNDAATEGLAGCHGADEAQRSSRP